MRVTMSSEMAIHAVWYLATFRKHSSTQAQDLATSLSVSPSYMVKVLKKLAKAGILISKRGKHGGFQLGREPEDISLADIVETVERETIEFSCLQEERLCPPQSTCPIHDAMSRASAAARAELESVRISDLVSHKWRAPLPEAEA